MFDLEGKDLHRYVPELGAELGESLLTPTKIYVKPVLKLMEQVKVHGVSHITGGGFYENIPRCLPDGLRAKIQKGSLHILPIFDLIAKEGDVPERDMFNTYNMGVGMALIVPAAEADKAVAALKAEGQEAYVMGEILRGEKGVELC